ncbi:hypothetical protein ACYRFT_03735 [Listeria kieliensis]
MSEATVNSFLIGMILVVCMMYVFGIVALRRGDFVNCLIRIVTNREVQNLLIGAKELERKKAVQYLTIGITSLILGFGSIVVFANLEGFRWGFLIVLGGFLISSLFEKKAEEILGKKVKSDEAAQTLK